MNGDDTDSGIAHTEAWPVALEGSSPNWLEDGYGIQGPQGEVGEEDVQEWDTNAWSDNTQANEDFSAAGAVALSVQGDTGFVDNVNHIQFTVGDPCVDSIDVADGGGGVAIVTIPALPVPGGSGTDVFGSIDGACQWIDTTTCP